MFRNTALTRTAARIAVVAAVAAAPVGLTAAAAFAQGVPITQQQQGDEIWGHRGHDGGWGYHPPRWHDGPPVWSGPGYYRPPTGSASGSY
ncbi:hypothetical protein [Nocardia sp. BMG111209]|uniref:hypothetical protein n=1 Tax=Nocardia sp. BMG111209 TaxID=1160137 RepID=UPI00037A74E1|nr:hypothetical protein [Nocardia sp. BMG111209]